jgi:hypothetical protein
MQFMMIVKAGGDCETGKRPGDEVRTALRNYTEKLRKAGVLVELSRLHPSSKGARVKLSKGIRTVTDGPFAETKELIAGYWIIQVRSMEDAIEWAKRVPATHGEEEESEIEIRQFLEVEEFAPIDTLDRAVEPGKALVKTKKQSQ